jgi:uncharacterized protein (DUF1697 family)
MIKMAELKVLFGLLGYKNVTTYINSGNIGFDTRTTNENKLRSHIESAIEKDLGKHVPVIIRKQNDIGRIIGANPFAGEFESHKEMHVLFLTENMPEEKERQLLEAAPDGERFAVNGREIYCHLPKGVIDSLLGKSFIEKKLKLAVTGRNWRTVEKLAVL